MLSYTLKNKRSVQLTNKRQLSQKISKSKKNIKIEPFKSKKSQQKKIKSLESWKKSRRIPTIKSTYIIKRLNS